ncbi:hypothetical protein ERJ75_001294800 [Trypanosoma vivax]|nr:hypothetical protein ERJ75_001294800 [Trypanosoma vivax]
MRLCAALREHVVLLCWSFVLRCVAAAQEMRHWPTWRLRWRHPTLRQVTCVHWTRTRDADNAAGLWSLMALAVLYCVCNEGAAFTDRRVSERLRPVWSNARGPPAEAKCRAEDAMRANPKRSPSPCDLRLSARGANVETCLAGSPSCLRPS